MAAPKYRADIAGNVKAHVAECEATMRGQIQHGDSFTFCAEDCDAWEEYANTLTEAEMRAAFKRAQRPEKAVA